MVPVTVALINNATYNSHEDICEIDGIKLQVSSCSGKKFKCLFHCFHFERISWARGLCEVSFETNDWDAYWWWISKAG